MRDHTWHRAYPFPMVLLRYNSPSPATDQKAVAENEPNLLTPSNDSTSMKHTND